MIHYLRFLTVCFVCCVGPFVGATKYDRLSMAVPRSVFEQHYTIETSTQTLKAGSRYKYLGKVAEFYFINHIFEDESTHLVRVPIKNGDQVLLQREDDEVVVLNTFELNFKQASVLFYPSQEYTVVEEKENTLVVQVDDIDRQLEVPKARFTLKHSLVARPEADASSADA